MTNSTSKTRAYEITPKMQDHPGTRTLVLWREYVYLKKSIHFSWSDFSVGDAIIFFFSFKFVNTQSYPLSNGFLKMIMGKLEATEPPTGMAFLVVCVSSPFITAFIKWCSSNNQTMLYTTSSHFHFQPSRLRTKVLTYELFCEHLLLFSYFH